MKYDSEIPLLVCKLGTGLIPPHGRAAGVNIE
jgi:hypothetical protein